ncbi:MAG: lysophospholipid acyltransferase family protein [Rhodospirillales bacterium]
MKSHRLLTAVRALPFVVSCLLFFWAYALCAGPLARWRRPLQVWWCRVCLWMTGLRLRSYGRPVTEGVVLYVANHVSYLDIPVISRLVTGTFIAKSEVAGWALFGYAARITGTIFINRVGSEAKSQQEMLVRRLAGGEHLIMFPEGTSTDGSGVAPFKSSLFSLAEDPALRDRLIIQPLSLAYTCTRDGTPLVGPLRDRYAWFGDASLAPHLARVLGTPGGEVELRFLEPIPAVAVADRKILARQAEAAVKSGIDASFAPYLGDGETATASSAGGAAPTDRGEPAASA